MARVFLLSLALWTATAAVAAEPRPNLHLGLWHVDVEMTLPGKGPQTNGNVTQEVCLNAANIGQIVMPKNPFCDGRVTKQAAGEMDWRMQCNQGGTNTFSRAHFEFGGDQFTGAILTTAQRFNMEFKTIVRGKYQGVCSAEQARQALGPVQNPPSPKAPPASASAKPPQPLAPYKP